MPLPSTRPPSTSTMKPGVRRNARTLKQAFAWCEDFEEYFAIKALLNPAILRILKEEGCGVDCSSDTELMLADACGFSGRDIDAFCERHALPLSSTMPAVARSLISTISPILTFSVSTVVFPKPSAAAITPAETSKSDEIMGNPGDAKYGFTYAQLQEGLKRLRTWRKALRAARFPSSNNTDDNDYPALAKILFTCGRDLAAETGLELAFINLSGGIGIPYRPDQPVMDVLAVGEGVRKVYEEIFPERRRRAENRTRPLDDRQHGLACHARDSREAHLQGSSA